MAKVHAHILAHMKIIEIIDIIVIDLLTDIPRQVASECHWPAAQSRMFASAWQHLCCEAGYASSEFLRPFESPWICGGGGGSKPWKCVLGHGAMCGPPKHGWDSGLVLIAVFEAQFFLGARTEVHATSSNMPPSEVRTKELYMIDTRDQLKVIENVANYHWWCLVFLCHLLAEQLVAPAIHKGLALLWTSIWQSWLRRRSQFVWSTDESATTWVSG